MAATAHTVRPFDLLGKSRLQQLADIWRNTVSDWGQAWGIAAESLQTECLAADVHAAQFASLPWQPLKGQSKVWQAASTDFLPQLQQTLFASRQGQMAQQLMHQAWEELPTFCSAMWQKPGWQPEHSKDCFAQGRSCVVAKISLGGAHAEYLFAAPAQTMQAGSGQLQARAKVLGRQDVHLQVEAGRAELSLAQLMGLAVGDVLRLESALDQPLTVCNAQGKPMFQAWLGKQEDTIAVELIKRA